MITIEKELSNLSNNFSDNSIGVQCRTDMEKNAAIRIFNEHYKNIKVFKKLNEDKVIWKISCSTPIKEELLREDEEDLDNSNKLNNDIDDDNEVEADVTDNDTEEVENSVENLDTIDDMSEIDKADKMTILKKKLSKLTDDWKSTYKQLYDLGNALGITVSHDDELNLKFTKPDGKKSDFEQDLDDIDKKINQTSDSDIDDDFGLSDYEDRAKYLQDSEQDDVKYQESLNVNSENVTCETVNESINLNTSDGIYINEDDIDDDF